MNLNITARQSFPAIKWAISEINCFLATEKKVFHSAKRTIQSHGPLIHTFTRQQRQAVSVCRAVNFDYFFSALDEIGASAQKSDRFDPQEFLSSGETKIIIAVQFCRRKSIRLQHTEYRYENYDEWRIDRKTKTQPNWHPIGISVQRVDLKFLH